MTMTAIPTRDVSLDVLLQARAELDVFSGTLRRAGHNYRSTDRARRQNLLERADKIDRLVDQLDQAVRDRSVGGSVPDDLHTEA